MKFKAFHGDLERDVDVEPFDGGYLVIIDGVRHEVDTTKLEGSLYSLLIGNKSYEVSVTTSEADLYDVRHGGSKASVRFVDPLSAAAGAHLAHTGPAEITAAMPGRVVKVLVEEGQEIVEGQGLIILEAMKMENEVAAPRDGTITNFFVQPGQTLESGEKIAIIE